MTKLRIQEVDQKTRGLHYRLEKDDNCFYLGEYTARAGFGHSDINQLIHNLKKHPSTQRTNPAEYTYKLRAIDEVSDKLRAIISEHALNNTITLVPIPPSKTKKHPDYDDRIERICANIVKGLSTADVQHLIINNVDIEPTHNDAAKPSPNELIQNYSINADASYRPRQTVILIDDMLTTGTHFKACQKLILQTYPDAQVVGIFISRRVYSDPFTDFL